jgi:uncharacterized DUF497 family protein
MDDDGFQWGSAKAAANLAEHGVSFELARKVFKDAFALDWPDGRENYGEERYCTIGMADDRLLFVAYTMRDDSIRIISARGAEPHERRRYHEHNA